MMNDHIPWIEKYRPRQLNDLVLSNNLMQLFKNCAATGSLSHLLFYGPPGTGKTSAILAIGREIFKEHFSTRVIEFNASDDRGINAVREKITNEAKKYVTSLTRDDGYKLPAYKIIILDEADSMTDEAQDALRVVIEQYSTVTRFCFICNYISKITDAIKSRCATVFFKKLSNDCILTKLKEIVTKESMVLDDKVCNEVIKVSNGDMRKAIMILHNIKYLYQFKQFIHKPIVTMNYKELRLVNNLYIKDDARDITKKDIYNIAAQIDLTMAREIINNTLEFKNIIQISDYAKQIIVIGYPVDNILLQLNKVILKMTNMTDLQKAQIILYSGRIFLKIKECANEYIQLLDYLSCVKNIYNSRGLNNDWQVITSVII